MSERKMIVCDCGFGEGFYHYERNSYHEYNPSVPTCQATSVFHKDRQPIAEFFGNIDGRKVTLIIYNWPGAQLKKDQTEYSLYYRDHGSREKAIAAAASLLNKDKDQLQLF